MYIVMIIKTYIYLHEESRAVCKVVETSSVIDSAHGISQMSLPKLSELCNFSHIDGQPWSQYLSSCILVIISNR